jgi:hypothetical protein
VVVVVMVSIDVVTDVLMFTFTDNPYSHNTH